MAQPTLTRRRLTGLTIAALASSATPGSAATANVKRPLREIAAGLRFPEGPLAASDGSVFLSEIAEGHIARIAPDGSKTIVAEPGGGPNGLAFGPDGKIYCCNGGGFTWVERDGLLSPTTRAADYTGGRIERIDPHTGEVEILYDSIGGRPLSAPNDLVFDGQGGFWFTDAGASTEHTHDFGGLYYAKADGSKIEQMSYPLYSPNGIGLSPDGNTVFVALTAWREIRAFDLAAPGELAPPTGGLLPGRAVHAFASNRLVDSMAMDADGNVCVARMLDAPGISVVSPEGALVEHVPTPDAVTTNICFGGPDMRIAFVTQSSTGRLLAIDWPRPGLRLHHSQ